ncbi:hypothetical protein B0H17DRAFT_1133120 [Mycena rosella]|uniref:Uncharacterized protein n=1 Tax=Mycena rosella TaxID=1033263 RepID=A0AAD7DKK3_MYCRO|nr:hypothetical protein B0H17DRAFT_1133120 [Mycena rosella]
MAPVALLRVGLYVTTADDKQCKIELRKDLFVVSNTTRELFDVREERGDLPRVYGVLQELDRHRRHCGMQAVPSWLQCGMVLETFLVNGPQWIPAMLVSGLSPIPQVTSMGPLPPGKVGASMVIRCRSNHKRYCKKNSSPLRESLTAADDDEDIWAFNNKGEK